MRRLLPLFLFAMLAACATPPAAPTLYLVFFPADSEAITPIGRVVIDRAINDARGQKPRIVTVNGYADRTGPAERNQELSERRAEAVANALVAGGVERAAIRLVGHGEDPLPDVSTDGRRVEIKLLR